MKTQLFTFSFISGLAKVVRGELSTLGAHEIVFQNSEVIYAQFAEVNFRALTLLRSVTTVSRTERNQLYNPKYLARHKSVLGDIVREIVTQSPDTFKTFSISCAGSDSLEVRSIAQYIVDTYKLTESTESDLKVAIRSIENTWEVSVQITARPLSMRAYKVAHIEGAMNPTIAYAVNSLVGSTHAKRYLNICSGSATLLIEASMTNSKISCLGFDNNPKTISLAIQNIRKAGLLQRVQLKQASVFENPDFGEFDVIVSDLPFGMSIAKGEDLEKLYTSCVSYATEHLAENGVIALYTSETELLESVLEKSEIMITKVVQLKLVTSVGSYLHPKIYICRKRAEAIL